MTNVNIELSGLYSRKDKVKKLYEYRIFYEAQVEARHGFWDSFKNVNGVENKIASTIKDTDRHNNIENPKHNLNRVKGPMPTGEEFYTDKPPKTIIKKLEYLLRNGIITSKDEN